MSAEKVVAIAPFGQVSRRFDASCFGVFHGAEHARMPEGPSTMTSRTSPAVRPTSAMRRFDGRSRAPTCSSTHSAPHRVLPKPRPAQTNQISQASPFASALGASCLGRACHPRHCPKPPGR